MRNWKFWLIYCLLIIVGGCSQAEEVAAPMPTDPPFTRQVMLQHLVNEVILPLNDAFVRQTAVLETAAHTFDNDPTLPHLQTLQDEWQTTAAIWQQAELYEFDRLMVLHNQIRKSPANTAFIEQSLGYQPDDIDAAFIESMGSTAKGLPAIEYLIFDAARDDEAALARLTQEANSHSRRQYLVAATENLHIKAVEVQTYWLADGRDYAAVFMNADGDGETFTSSISMLTNAMVTVLERVIREKVGRPLGLENGNEPQPELVKGGLSGSSLSEIVQNINSVEQAFTGGDGPGLDDYLDYLGAEHNGQPLSNVIKNQFETTYTALDTIEPPLATAVVTDTETVQVAYDELRTLLILIKVDMANQLGVTITFNDSDGD